MDLLGLKTGVGAGQHKEKREKSNGLVGAKNGSGQANLRKKKEKTNGLVGSKNRGRGGPT